MKKILFIGALIFSLEGLAQVSKANEILQQLIAKHNVVGAAAGYSVDGDTKWQNGAGYADESTRRKFETGTISRLASIAKPMTAIAVMQLVEQGKIDLDVPIQTYLSAYPKQAKTQITTRHLLSHTSGIDGYKNGREAQTTQEYARLEDAMVIFKDRDLLFEPGTRFNYTTYGYTVLGVIIEKVSGMSFENYMQRNIWDVVGMQNTGIEKFGRREATQSALYHQNNKGKTKEGKENNLSNRFPGGGIHSNVEDLLKFGNAVINNLLINESTMNLMREHHSLEKEKNGYGFGWFLYYPKPDEGKIIGHSGEQTGSATQLVIIPGLKTVVVVLSNTSGTSRYITSAAFNIFSALKEE